MNPAQTMCPHCGKRMKCDGLTPTHDYPELTRQVCPGSRQTPRNIYDRRFLWNGERPVDPASEEKATP